MYFGSLTHLLLINVIYYLVNNIIHACPYICHKCLRIALSWIGTVVPLTSLFSCWRKYEASFCLSVGGVHWSNVKGSTHWHILHNNFENHLHKDKKRLRELKEMEKIEEDHRRDCGSYIRTAFKSVNPMFLNSIM